MKYIWCLIPLLAACEKPAEPARVNSTEGGGFSEVICVGWCKWLDATILGETELTRTPVRGPLQ